MSEDERIRARNAILARRARFIAAALGSAALTASCGGKVEESTRGGNDDDGITWPDTCLSICLGVCLQPPCDYNNDCDPYGTGGFGVCLGAPCLEPPWGGHGGAEYENEESEDAPDGSGGKPESD